MTTQPLENRPNLQPVSLPQRIGAVQTLSDLIKLELNADYSTAEKLVTKTGEARAFHFAFLEGAIKYSYRVRSSAVDGADSVDVKDSSVSLTTGSSG